MSVCEGEREKRELEIEGERGRERERERERERKGERGREKESSACNGMVVNSAFSLSLPHTHTAIHTTSGDHSLPCSQPVAGTAAYISHTHHTHTHTHTHTHNDTTTQHMYTQLYIERTTHNFAKP